MYTLRYVCNGIVWDSVAKHSSLKSVKDWIVGEMRPKNPVKWAKKVTAKELDSHAMPYCKIDKCNGQMISVWIRKIS